MTSHMESHMLRCESEILATVSLPRMRKEVRESDMLEIAKIVLMW